MPGQDTSAYDEVFKTVYGDGIKELIPTKVRVLEMFMEKDSKPWGGRHVEYPARVGRNQGSGWATELGNIPTAGRQRYAQWRIPMHYQYGRIQISAQVMKASEGARNAFAGAMSQEMDGIIKDMSADRGRAIFGDGKGILALVNGDPGVAATVTVDAPGGVAGATNGARFINPGMIVGFINPADGSLRASNRTVVSVAAAGTSIVLDSGVAAAVADNDFLVRVTTAASTDVSDSSYQKEMMGLLGLIDDGTYVATLHNLNRTAYPLAGSAVISGVGSLSSDVMQRAIDVADERGDGDISDIICHHSVRRAYIATTEDDRRYVGQDLQSPDAGTGAAKRRRLTFGSIPITEDKYAPYGMAFFADTSGFTRWTLAAGEWADEDGSVLKQVGTGGTLQDAYEAYYRIWDNIQNDFPNRCARLDGITATVVVVHID